MGSVEGPADKTTLSCS